MQQQKKIISSYWDFWNTLIDNLMHIIPLNEISINEITDSDKQILVGCLIKMEDYYSQCEWFNEDDDISNIVADYFLSPHEALQSADSASDYCKEMKAECLNGLRDAAIEFYEERLEKDFQKSLSDYLTELAHAYRKQSNEFTLFVNRRQGNSDASTYTRATRQNYL